jgi:acyl-CoA dehydrogenase
MAKLFGTETAQQIIDMAVQLHGGIGVVAETMVENLYREIRPLRIYEGASEIQRLVIANEVMRAAAVKDG